MNAGPTVPRAGPTFPIEAAEPPIAEIKSRPWILNSPAPIIKRIRYSIKKPRILIITSFLTTL